jgi:hypothetical protein
VPCTEKPLTGQELAARRHISTDKDMERDHRTVADARCRACPIPPTGMLGGTRRAVIKANASIVEPARQSSIKTWQMNVLRQQLCSFVAEMKTIASVHEDIVDDW